MSIFVNIQHLRQEYQSAILDESDISPNPIEQFARWFDDALKTQKEPNAMTLATTSLDGKPSLRTLLLKGFDHNGFSFFSNYNSRKGEELAHNSQASMLFFWLDLERQINIEGIVKKMSREDSEAYFKTRPRDSKIGAWVSMQDAEITDRNVLKKDLKAMIHKFENQDDIPMPLYWGGYTLVPSKIEFWQGRPARLHDRLVYNLEDNNIWTIKRLAP